MFNEIFNDKQMQELQDLLRKNKSTITTAESCTGGLVSFLITNQSGSSDIFNGSIISYSNKIKNQELFVKNSTLENFGAVSKEVVNEMLIGISQKLDASFSIAISGIAGPNGGTKSKPVGTVVIGIMGSIDSSVIETFCFKGNRKEVQYQAAKTALKRILIFVKKTLDK